MIKRIITPSIFLSAAFFNMQTIAEEQRTDFDLDDDGLIEINDLNDLSDMRNHLNGRALYSQSNGCPELGCIGFELTRDLDFDTNGDGMLDALDGFWGEGEGWLPLGNILTQGFSGVFEGNGFQINNLFINRPKHLEVGLFGYANGGYIQNVGVGSSVESVTGLGTVGGLIGYAQDTQIKNCFSQVDVFAKRGAGGLVGQTIASSVVSSHSSGDVYVESTYAGGLIGTSVDSNIVGSYATGDVFAAERCAGGLLGCSLQVITSITASYATGEVFASNAAGGLVGSNANIEASFSTGGVHADGESIGGLMGLAGEGVVLNSYWATDTSGLTQSSGGGVGATLAELKCAISADSQDCAEQVLFSNWDSFIDTNGDAYWEFGTNEQLPSLRLLSEKADGNAKDREEKAGGAFSFFEFWVLLLIFLSGKLRFTPNLS